MGFVEETRQVLQDFLAPELREIRGALSAIDKRLDSQDKRLDTIEDANRARHENIIQRLEQINNPSPSTSASPTSKRTSAAPPSSA
jgi:uncharacterized membrane protein YccC